MNYFYPLNKDPVPAQRLWKQLFNALNRGANVPGGVYWQQNKKTRLPQDFDEMPGYTRFIGQFQTRDGKKYRVHLSPQHTPDEIGRQKPGGKADSVVIRLFPIDRNGNDGQLITERGTQFEGSYADYPPEFQPVIDNGLWLMHYDNNPGLNEAKWRLGE